jgi:hypothetical protein
MGDVGVSVGDVGDYRMTHSPTCIGGPLATTRGHSVTVVTCQTCGCLSTVRHHVTVNERTNERTMTRKD